MTAPALFETLWQMLKDRDVWRSTLLVALFNIALFRYYSLGPFVFQRLGLSTQGFGYNGVILTLGSGLGAWLNKRLLQRGFNGLQLNAGGDVGIGGRCRDSKGRGHSMLQRNLAFRCRS
ncbi:hypothetical protein [Pseudomonas mandelii]|uniref:hypothetical protein n=1 Tax=Pseudomonas mandelii TaxID=75612 RepID=UPI0031F418BE